MKIIITEAAVLSNGDLDFSQFEKLGELKVFDNMPYSLLEKEIYDTDILLCNKLTIDKNILDKAKSLKYIGTFATGYNNIDTAYCRTKGITVCNAGSYSTEAVAQQTFGYILNRFCRLNDYNTFVKSGGWTKSPVFSPLVFPTEELQNKTLGIIGFGSIGKRVYEIAKAFKMNVKVFTRTVPTDSDICFVDFSELLSTSDIVTVHCPLTEHNAEMFNKDTFSLFKKGAYFINTARGGLVNEQDLLEAVESGHLSGAAVDVLIKEPMDKTCPLIKSDKITITPHSAWTPTQTRERLFGIVLNNIKAFLGGNPINKVN